MDIKKTSEQEKEDYREKHGYSWLKHGFPLSILFFLKKRKTGEKNIQILDKRGYSQVRIMSNENASKSQEVIFLDLLNELKEYIKNVVKFVEIIEYEYHKMKDNVLERKICN